jgi:hypothetical protein
MTKNGKPQEWAMTKSARMWISQYLANYAVTMDRPLKPDDKLFALAWTLDALTECDIVATVSARALIIFEPIFRSFAQCGTKPQRSASRERSLLWGLNRTVSTGSGPSVRC